MSAFTVLVAGAGVGGLTFAKAVQIKGEEIMGCGQEVPLKVVVLERASHLPSSGHGLTLFEGVGILRRIELGEALDKLSSLLTRQVVTADGSLLLDTRTGSTSDVQQGQYAPRGIRRPDLVRLLKSSLNNNTIIKFDWEIVKVVQEGEKVRVINQRNEEMIGDMLVGFDGIGSQVRVAINNNQHCQSQTNNQTKSSKEFGRCCVLLGTARITGTNENTHKIPATTQQAARTLVHHFDRTLGSVGVYSGTTNEKFAWTIGYRCPNEPERNPDWYNNDKALAAAKAVVNQWSSPPKQAGVSDFDSLLSHSEECLQLGVYTQYTEESQRPWFNGRIVCGGDAAHAVLPLLGEGANLAMADAAVLARHIVLAATLQHSSSSSRNNNNDKPIIVITTKQLEEVFQKYEAERRGPSQSGMAMTKALRPIMLAQNWFVCQARNILLSHVVAANWSNSHFRGQDAFSLLDHPMKKNRNPHANIGSTMGMLAAHVAVLVGVAAVIYYNMRRE